MGFFSALFPALLNGLFGGFGGGRAAAPPAPPSDVFGPGPGGLTEGAVSAGDRAAGGFGLGGILGSSLSSVIANAMFGGLNARLAGKHQRMYNNAAYPGTVPWEQLGTGSAGAQAGSMASPELLQRERESKRSAQVALQTSRMSASAGLAGHAMAAGGAAAGPLVASLLRAGGILPPGVAFDPRIMARGKPEAEIAALDAGARRVETLLPLEAESIDADVHRKRMETLIAPFEFALKEWEARYGHSYAANEARGVAESVREALPNFARGSRDGADILPKLLAMLETKWGFEIMKQFSEIYDMVP